MSEGMLKLVYLLRRRPEMSREDFQAYWRERHAPLVASFAERLNMRRYTQSHTVETPLQGAMADSRGCAPADFDGVAELWWDGEDAVGGRASEQLEAARELLKDEARFIDLPRSVLFFTREHAIVPPANPK